MNHYFIAGTDTDVGKTRIAAALLYAARQRGLTTAGVKPVAAGCEESAEGLRNDDALRLQAQCEPPLDYSQVNPVALAPPIAPHIAAAEKGVSLSVAELLPPVRDTLSAGAEFALVEGAGGWRVPLNERETLADLAVALKLPVILVVGVRLGCINHALLSAEAIRADGLPLAGWVANGIDPQAARAEENIDTLRHWLQAPCLGVVPFCDGGEAPELARYLDLSSLVPAGYKP
ncbi:dethiobiotin synthase [Gilvimarinus xylanilyticus]|uniref:ATP-dependent dethiobiotin synthetase BioD n=1 Tax=Gilvimarinus xylanilyticus TaxID=2944139 RepID=A0A9X2KTC9_9GAMM|nr:dethiobiotin synthase [Gilvimarinus xylanilyticus]MCP8899786.1 dethiobiotin synthase [Gilvimarinus xylanilyticus]